MPGSVVYERVGSTATKWSIDSSHTNAVQFILPDIDRVVGRPADDANVGRCPWQVLSCVLSGCVGRTHRGGSIPRVYTERSDRPWVTLNFCVMRRYNLEEGGLVSAHEDKDNCV